MSCVRGGGRATHPCADATEGCLAERPAMAARRPLLAIALALLLAETGECAILHHKFGYKPAEQKRWHEFSGSCKGSYQSPVHIINHRVVPLALPALETLNYQDLLPLPLCITNTGHSVSLAAEAGGAAAAAGAQAQTRRWPQVLGAVFDGAYEMESLHFHWGHRNSRGSEHVLSGIRFPLEMHIIHRKVQYSTVEEALQHPDGLAVVAFFFQVREKRNTQLHSVLRLLRRVRRPGQRACLARPLALSSLLSGASTRHFYTYRGSLTTPPCAQAVVWLVVPDPLFISYRQIKRFRQLKSHNELRLGQNYRLTQPLNNRIIYKRDPWIHNKRGTNVTQVRSLRWTL